MASGLANAATMTSYYKLIRQFPLVQIKNEKHLDEATEVLHSLLGKAERDKGEEEYLSVLTDLIEAYEDEHYPIEGATPAEILGFLVEDRGLSQTELAKKTGIAQSTLSSLISGTRTPTAEHVVILAKFFHVGAEAFLPQGGE